VQALNNFRANLHLAMRLQGVSQRTLGNQAGVNYVHINRILNRRASPSLAICESLANALGHTLEEMIRDPVEFQKNYLSAGARA